MSYTGPEKYIPISVRKGLTYTTARHLGAGALALGVGDLQRPGQKPLVLLELVDVVEPGIGKYSTSPAAEILRGSAHGMQEIANVYPEGWEDFWRGMEAGDFNDAVNMTDTDN